MEHNTDHEDYQKLAIASQDIAGRFNAKVIELAEKQDAAFIENLFSLYQVNAALETSHKLLNSRLTEFSLTDKECTEIECIINVILSYSSMYSVSKAALSIIKKDKKEIELV